MLFPVPLARSIAASVAFAGKQGGGGGGTFLKVALSFARRPRKRAKTKEVVAANFLKRPPRKGHAIV